MRSSYKIDSDKFDYYSKKLIQNDKKKLYESIKDMDINNIYALEYLLELEKELNNYI